MPLLSSTFTNGSSGRGGLPNIKAQWKPTFGWIGGASTSGSFSALTVSGGQGTPSSNTNFGIEFDASKSSPLYGLNNAVIPQYLVMKWCIKY